MPNPNSIALREKRHKDQLTFLNLVLCFEYYFFPLKLQHMKKCKSRVTSSVLPAKKIDVYGSVQQKMYSMFRVDPHPSSGAQNYIYSTWYLSKSCCYLPLSWKSWDCSLISSTIAAGSSNGLTNTRRCRYSFVLLMMGRDTTRNIYVEQFTEIENCVTLHLLSHTLECLLRAWTQAKDTEQERDRYSTKT